MFCKLYIFLSIFSIFSIISIVSSLKMSRLGALHCIKNTAAQNTGTVIFFHGSGASGGHMKEWVQIMADNFSFPHLKILFPTAPLQPYTPAGGAMTNVWFDRLDIKPTVPEATQSLAKINADIKYLIKKENEAGIPTNRIIVGGFSMGGALAFHIAYNWEPNVAGCFAFSSFLNENSAVYEKLKENNDKVPPLLQIHGNSDDLVHFSWGENTFSQLKSLGVPGEFHVLDKLGHSINRRGLNLIKAWINKHLPEI
ncbi:lysophospholipase-like protein 1 [Leptidea sinapis]|uniref:palmitoyl-protein hydrolase n=1 Tax=Leptidea sinapis TaxID=189913 RepID=A0A5E4PMC4_9NEOP|nr:lysophospholipase-like protein 1 [Leptidea sinapis]VVC86218.1 unnamed protein product [Leptidea sinapis]